MQYDEISGVVAEWANWRVSCPEGHEFAAQVNPLFYHVATFGRLFTPRCLLGFQPYHVPETWYWTRLEVTA